MSDSAASKLHRMKLLGLTGIVVVMFGTLILTVWELITGSDTYATWTMVTAISCFAVLSCVVSTRAQTIYVTTPIVLPLQARQGMPASSLS